MWPDNETSRDFLNFTGVAETVAEIIMQAKGRPISIGVSGAWGVGKSSMIMLIRDALEKRSAESAASGEPANSEYIFVQFNAWLYQGYDDARAALMEVIGTTLAKEAKKRRTAVQKVSKLLKRVDWLRAAKMTAGTAIALGSGLAPVGLIGEVLTLVKKAQEHNANPQDLEKLEAKGGDLADKVVALFKEKKDTSPPKEIHAIRESFQEVLKDLGIKLVVLIDDLDRCLPDTTISTLEAIRLFLFLDSTAFVIAADDALIKNAVRKHFDGVENAQIVSYFDKLIQVPIRVPQLGTQEVKAYLMLLYVENSDLNDENKEIIRTRVCEQLGQTWRGKRVDRAFMQSLNIDLPGELIARFDTAERLAPLMTKTTQISGNPRLIKRFLNAQAIRMAIARSHGVAVDESALAKVLLFERCGKPAAYEALGKAVYEDEEGKPRLLAEWEEKANSGQQVVLTEPWNDDFVQEWLTLSPRLADIDLRGILYVSREHAPLITAEDHLSSEGADILDALFQYPESASHLHDRLIKLSRIETTIIMDGVLNRARKEQEWGTPPILYAALALAIADPALGQRLAAFLAELPPQQIKPGIIPLISDQTWVQPVFDKWLNSSVSAPVTAAIKARASNGNIAK